ncbi:MAG: MBL fold metallo-hydrolase [Bacteroidota bacterium]|nr:MBL fold metallo-hydrolase [Bacteroidota bacterium]
MIKVIDLQFLGLTQAIASFLIITDDGPLLIETGPASTLKALKKGILEAGHQPEDIKHVFITHIHLDHAGAAWWFAERGATIYMHPKGLPHMKDPSKLMDSAKRIYQEKMDSLWGPMNAIKHEQIKGVEDGEQIEVGNNKIHAWHTPGHAVHHVAWQWEDNLFTGDVAGVKIAKGPVVPPCPPPDINLEDWNSSIEKIMQLPVKDLYLTHFGKVADKRGHLQQLKYILNDWANWIKKRWEEGRDVQSVVPDFQKYVSSQLKDKGVDETGIQQYEAANPSWMSVSGIMRYWEKTIKS